MPKNAIPDMSNIKIFVNKPLANTKSFEWQINITLSLPYFCPENAVNNYVVANSIMCKSQNKYYNFIIIIIFYAIVWIHIILFVSLLSSFKYLM